MAGPVVCRAIWSPRYSGSVVASLRLAAVLAFALGSALSLGGCAVSGAMFSKSGTDAVRAAYASEDSTGFQGSPDRSIGSARRCRPESWSRQTLVAMR